MNKIKIVSIISIFISLIFLLTTSARSNPYYSLNLLGQPWTCSLNNGQLVPIYLNPNLPDVGMAKNYPPQIVLNPNVMNNFSPLMQVFWLAHECVHATNFQPPGMNPEIDADCKAIKQLKNLNLNPSQLNQIAYETLPLTGSHSGHLAGPYRTQLIAQCYFNPY